MYARTFTVDYEEFGVMKSHALKPGGEGVNVTNANRTEYVELYVKWMLETSIAAQFTAFADGFHEVPLRCCCRQTPAMVCAKAVSDCAFCF